MLENRYLTTLELDKILNLLSAEATVSDAKNIAINLKPSNKINTVKDRLRETDQAYVLTAKFGVPSFGQLKNTESAIKRAESGSSLSMSELLDIGENLRVMRSLKAWKNSCSGVECDILDAIFDGITVNKYLEERITSSIKSEEELYDEASPDLSNIRRKLKSEGLNIKDKLEKMIRSNSFSKYLQDTIITKRDGRYVVPVKTEYRSFVQGLVHDTSSSGATLFIEPLTVVEANNQIKVLLLKEKDEIERILSEISKEVAEFANLISESYNNLVKLNFIFAKSNLAFKMKAINPKLNTNGEIKLKNARHPLINKKDVVPISLTLGKEFDTLVITGPNTGGKTVTIKTIGLLTLMAMCGLFIPADDGSEISVFNYILADIGDEQSIEQSLSTFSSHIKNIIEILNCCNNNSLVLVDELGAGTDPIEGAALATSVLMELRNKGCKIAATTHYNELKMYALNTEGVCNASCEFDIKTLQPTYKLILGTPGSSNAFAISKKLGLNESVVNTAKNLISRENSDFEIVVSKLERERRNTELEKERYKQLTLELNKQKNLYNSKLFEATKEKEKLLNSAREKAEYILEEARAETNRMLDELNSLKKENKFSNNERIALAKQSVNKGLSNIENIIDNSKKKETVPYNLPRDLKPGDEVEIIDLNKNAVVISEKDNKNCVEVQAGIIKTRVNINNLKLLENKKTVNKSNYRSNLKTKTNINKQASMEFDIRGLDSLEAIIELDKYIDTAILSGINSVSIIHGKGTGVLRKAVHNYLKTNKRVKSFRLGVFGEGESGVTIAELK